LHLVRIHLVRRRIGRDRARSPNRVPTSAPTNRLTAATGVAHPLRLRRSPASPARYPLHRHRPDRDRRAVTFHHHNPRLRDVILFPVALDVETDLLTGLHSG